jgi:hypothetical protein
MRKVLLAIGALAAVAIATPASAQHFRHGGPHFGGFHRGFGPSFGFGFGVGPSVYAYDAYACPLVRVHRHGRTFYVRDCY